MEDSRQAIIMLAEFSAGRDATYAYFTRLMIRRSSLLRLF